MAPLHPTALSGGSASHLQDSSGVVDVAHAADESSRPTSSSALLPSGVNNRHQGLASADAVEDGDSRAADDELMAPTRRKSGSSLQAGQQHRSSKGVNGYPPTGGEDSEQRLNRGLEMDDIDSDEQTLADDEETGLTEPQRKKRTLRKARSARLDVQVAGGGAASVRSGVSGISDASGGSIGTTEEKLARPTLIKNIILNAVLIGLWYSFSISISVYNKWMFSGDNLDFQFPLFTTSLHMLVQFSLANAVLYFLPQFRPGNSTTNPHEPSYSRVANNEDEEEPPTNTTTTTQKSDQPLMTKFFYLTRIGPCGTATAMDIGLGNFSLRFISLTFFTMCKSSVLGFVLLFAFIFRLEQPTWRLCAIIFLMTIGVIMMVAGETAFNALGFLLIMLASFCSGFRWSLTQILLLRNRATSNPFSSIFYLTPVMFLALLLLALPIEGTSNVIAGVKKLASAEGGFQSFCLLLFPGILAFLMVSSEFALLKRTSVVTLSVCGIFKEVLTISAAGAIFGDELSPVNVSGLFVTIGSIAAYNYLKYNKMKKEAAEEAREIIVAEAAEAVGDRNKGAVVVGPEATGERRDSSTALMTDSVHSKGGDGHSHSHDRGGHDTQTNGAIGAPPGKRPDHLD